MTKPRSRPYDDFIPGNLLSRVLARRENPDGIRHQIGTTRRAGRTVNKYPWDKMEVGDFFEVPIGNKSEKAMRVALAHAAARIDAEISVRLVKDSKDQHCFRVTVVIRDVSIYVKLAKEADVPVNRSSDGKWLARKRAWNKRPRTSAPPPPKAEPKPEQEPAPARELEIPEQKGPVAPEAKLTREEILRRAMGQP